MTKVLDQCTSALPFLSKSLACHQGPTRPKLCKAQSLATVSYAAPKQESFQKSVRTGVVSQSYNNSKMCAATAIKKPSQVQNECTANRTLETVRRVFRRSGQCGNIRYTSIRPTNNVGTCTKSCPCYLARQRFTTSRNDGFLNRLTQQDFKAKLPAQTHSPVSACAPFIFIGKEKQTYFYSRPNGNIVNTHKPQQETQ